MHYYQFNIGDYAKSTLHLSLMEDLAYRRLLDRYYDTEKPLEADIDKLCRFVRMGDYKKETQQILDEFFSLTQKGWIQKRVAKELGQYSAKADSARANGKKGGRPKKTQPVNSANPELTQQKAKQEPLNTNHKPLTKEIVIPDGINQPAWIEWVEYRKTKKKKVSQKAATKQFKLLSSYAFDVQQQIIDQSIQNDYQGLFEPKGDFNGRPQGHEGTQRPNQTGRPSVVDRVKRTAEDRERARSGEIPRASDGQAMDQANGDLRPQVAQPIRGDDTGSMGDVVEGSFTRAD